ncbi:MAG: alpha/beta hydrolase-fold protein [Bacteroidota bacterium]
MNPSVAKAWADAWPDRAFRRYFYSTIVILVIVLAGLSHFLEFVEDRGGVVVNDPVLQLVRPVDLTWLTFGLIYLGLVSGLAFLLRHPRILILTMQSYILMVAFRIAMMFVLPLDAPAGLIPLKDPFVQFFGSGKTPTRDLFFSGHTSTLFLLFLTAQKWPMKALFLACTVIVGGAVILQHVHYTIDVLAAPFVSYGAFRIVQRMHHRSPLRLISRDMVAARRSKTAVLLLLLAFAAGAHAQTRLREDSLISVHLGRTMHFQVIVPDGYHPSVKYPVLFLLHGLWGSYVDWTRNTAIVEDTRPYALIVVMPDAGNSWYLNSQASPADRFEDYLVEDLLPTVESRYAVDTNRRAIAGLSMGGYGSFMLSLRHPRLFRFAGGLSSAISIPRDVVDSAKGIRPGDAALFGPKDSCLAHDVVALTSGYSGGAATYFYAVAGIQDEYREFLPYHRVWTDSLRVKGIPYEYHEVPGRHNWTFWGREIVPLLARMAEILSITSVKVNEAH